MTIGKIIKKHIWGFILGPLIKMIEAVFDLLIPLIMKAIIDLTQETSRDSVSEAIGKFISLFGKWVDDPSLNYAIVGGTIIIVMGIIGFATTMVTQYIASDTATKCSHELRVALYEKVLSMSKQDIEMFGSDKILTILNADSFLVQTGIHHFIRLGTRAPFIILGSLVISLILDWQIGLVFAAIIPIILIIVFVIMRKVSKQYLEIQGKLDSLSTKTGDTLEGVRVVKAFNRESYEKEIYKKMTEDYKVASIKAGILNAMINPLTFAIISIATILVVMLGTISMSQGLVFNGYTLMPSTIITLVSYLDQIFVTLMLFTTVVNNLTKGIVSGRRCNQLLKTEPTIKNGSVKEIDESVESLLEFKNVFASYQDSSSDTYVLKDISFTLEKGKSLGIIGGTGCGKSTIVALIERFIDCNKGEVFFHGRNIKDYHLETLRNAMALVPQKSTLYKGTIRSNMQMADESISDEQILSALKAAMADSFVMNYSDTLDHEVEEGGRNFSGGQRQRLCIARALLKRGSLLILDDSTSALDLLTDRAVRHNISETRAGVSKILISQRIATVKDCDEILVLDAGRIVGKGTHEELLKSCQNYIETYQSQCEKGEH